jgi:20S proteasome subunit beta 7
MNPLWNSLIVGGYKDGQRCLVACFLRDVHTDQQPPFQSFLGYVDLLGVTYSASTLATGYGAYIAQPLLRKAVEGRETTLTEQEALDVMETCLRVLFYRDARSLNKVRSECVNCQAMIVDSVSSGQFQTATVTEKGVHISESRSLKTEWGFAEGYA